jgi:hypothetical protein
MYVRAVSPLGHDDRRHLNSHAGIADHGGQREADRGDQWSPMTRVPGRVVVVFLLLHVIAALLFAALASAGFLVFRDSCICVARPPTAASADLRDTRTFPS